MPTILSHPPVPLATRLGLGKTVVSGRLLTLAVFSSMLPDVDVIGFWRAVPYGSAVGHRGFTHSLTFAALLGLAAVPLAGRLRSSRLKTFLVIFASAASHGLLDALTDGGLGIGLLIPFSMRRFFAPWRPIVVSPLSITGFLNSRAPAVLRSELLYVWLPCLLVGGCLWGVRRWRRRSGRVEA